MKWRGSFSKSFRVTKGTRQGSLLSPLLFNIFIDKLLLDLKGMTPGVWIGSSHFNNFAYADDISVFSGTSCSLQDLIDRCASYASSWRFKFGVKKTKCMVMGHNKMTYVPIWKLDGIPVETTDNLEVLGMTFNSSLSSSTHLEKRKSKCRRSYYSLGEIGMTNSKVSPTVKSHLWRTICSPTLSYGLECLHISPREMKSLDSFQGTLIKGSLHIGKRSRSSSLMSAMEIPGMIDLLKQKTLSLLYNICQVPGPASDICLELAQQYIRTGTCVPGTLIARVIDFGVSPIHAIFNKIKVTPLFKDDG